MLALILWDSLILMPKIRIQRLAGLCWWKHKRSAIKLAEKNFVKLFKFVFSKVALIALILYRCGYSGRIL